MLWKHTKRKNDSSGRGRTVERWKGVREEFHSEVHGTAEPGAAPVHREVSDGASGGPMPRMPLHPRSLR